MKKNHYRSGEIPNYTSEEEKKKEFNLVSINTINELEINLKKLKQLNCVLFKKGSLIVKLFDNFV